VSECQYVVFQAVDGPLSDEQLAFAERQSSRAEVSRWSLAVEYHYSSLLAEQTTTRRLRKRGLLA